MLLLLTEATNEEKMNTCRTLCRPATSHIPLKSTNYSQKFGFVPHIFYLRFVTQIASKEETGKSQMGRGQSRGMGYRQNFCQMLQINTQIRSQNFTLSLSLPLSQTL